MRKTLLIVACTVAIPLVGSAQDQTDALRYSQTTFGGTARFMGMGGAFCAVGGDMSTLTGNPAGISVFTKSQLTFSPGVAFENIGSIYNGQSYTGEKSIMTIQNAGWLTTWKNSQNDAIWKGLNFAIVYNRTNNFNSNFTIGGNSSNSTLLDKITADANGTYYKNLDMFEAYPAYQLGLLNVIKGDSSHYVNIIDPYLGKGNNMINQQKSVQTSGSMGETDISFGGNYNNKLYLGASLGIPNIKYSENNNYSEVPNYQDTAYGLQNYSYNNSFTTTGGGVNFKIGFIYKAMEWLRIGGAVHTPTVFSLTDTYSSSMTATYGTSKHYNQGTYTSSGNSGTYTYTLTTPMRVMGGVAFIIHHQGILSADYEFIDYSMASLHSSPPDAFSPVNQVISKSYMGASNLRVGAEWVIYPFSIRAGYAYYGNPYTTYAGNSSIRSSYSAGFGIRFQHSFIDMAYVLTKYNENYYLYNSSFGVNAAKNQTNVSNIVFTFGINF